MLNCNIKTYGAIGDGKTLNTQAIQAAIDDCSAHGGGQVILEGGQYLSGRIDLKSGVELHLERDGMLLMSPNVNDFPEIESDFWDTEYAPRFNKRCFIYAENCTDIGITGRGVIDCQGENYVVPMSEEEIRRRPNMSFNRKPMPLPEGSEPLNEDATMVGSYPHPLDPRSTSLAPARVALFIGCENVLVEDVTMRNQPAGWSYWICGCRNVHFHRAQIRAAVDMPNNDGIHINCCQEVTISDCNISCGDDCIVVRAYSSPLKKPTVCEKVCVTNCNLTSHACGVRVGWINDGVIRNCTFSNLNITDSVHGISMGLPGNPDARRMSDQGEEYTLIENMSFTNIIIDRNYRYPVQISIAENNRCAGIRNIYFSNIHAASAQMPRIAGRSDCHVQNVYFDNCHFRQLRYEDIPTPFAARYAASGSPLNPPEFRCVDQLVFNSTTFSVI